MDFGSVTIISKQQLALISVYLNVQITAHVGLHVYATQDIQEIIVKLNRILWLLIK